ncbi:hypothetical protein [Flavilitoribacter nigricans]|uniref:Uncharacterized protein n=1 Tax=Flavilitoribacter nigricans (strain ATCC 23147 / DSM 23189 / NBRC 102662 / NCIMB 1420 / SS-2) TaxID=1122177 RepID=A0A2D0N1R7_FLAN2|nr:hypothetical protein [Flavilitoribacter nigricans]PHN02407.1 hypothetical protein CRP01_32000 [Flavilitoribacter nigricans DSM 23189 = NBRC 102662]
MAIDGSAGKDRSGYWDRFRSRLLRDFEAIFGVSYQIWVINTSDEAELFLWENWQRLYLLVDTLLRTSRDDAFIRTYQSFEFENKWLGFGRMKWNETNNQKWTSKYRSIAYQNRKLQFFNTEIWAPDWNTCIKNGRGPDVFINVYHHETIKEIREGIVIAIPRSAARSKDALLKLTIEALSDAIPQSTIATVDRHWNPGKGFVNRVEDMNAQELLKIVNGNR